ncbi:MAG: hypothetical protein HYY13_13945 [Nitrospirae bacterium]|nr:hypothetical protein [Nitrospirota bacterium]
MIGVLLLAAGSGAPWVLKPADIGLAQVLYLGMRAPGIGAASAVFLLGMWMDALDGGYHGHAVIYLATYFTLQALARVVEVPSGWPRVVLGAGVFAVAWLARVALGGLFDSTAPGPLWWAGVAQLPLGAVWCHLWLGAMERFEVLLRRREGVVPR